MIRFVDLETSNVFNGNKPYVFWMDKEQSINLLYTKRICVLSDKPVLLMNMQINNVFRFVNMQNLGEFADISVNDFNYKNLQRLYTNNYSSIGVQYGTTGYFVHMIYIIAQSTVIGEFHEDFSIDDETFEIAADFYAEDENLKINLANFGVELPESIQNAIYDVNVHEEANDDITLNRKYKELLLNYWNIVANRGSYKSLLNSLAWFEYGDIVKIEEIWKHPEIGREMYSRADLNQTLTTAVKATLSKFTKTTYIGLYAAMEKFARDERGEVANDHYLAERGFWGEDTPVLEALAMRWTREEMSLKMHLLGCFYEAYFMPIHLDLLQSTIEDVVFTNTIKILPVHNISRFDFLSNFDSFECNIKDGDVFQLGDVSVQAGDMLKKHYIDESDPDSYKTQMANVIEIHNESACLAFIAKSDNSSIGLERLSSNHTLEYSFDKENWDVFDIDTVIDLNNEQIVYVRGILEESIDDEYTQFKMSGRIACSGNCNCLWNYEDSNAQLLPYCGYNLFKDCSSLLNCPELPSTKLAEYCYYAMFYGCNNISKAPILPATELKTSCYRFMFSRSGLTKTPELPATQLSEYCYYSMFENCTNLLEAVSVLETDQLYDYCYAWMFYGCSSLTTAPELPATSLGNYCYRSMFYGCSSLTSVPELPATELTYGCYMYMFGGCSSLRIAQDILPATKLPRDPQYSGIGGHGLRFEDERYFGVYTGMFYGCRNLETAPILPAKQLTTSCYHAMFYYCTKLNRVVMLATDIQDQQVSEYIDDLNNLLHEKIGPSANADAQWLKKNTTIIWIDHSGTVQNRRWCITQDVYSQWCAIDTYYTHVSNRELAVLTPEEIDEIIEQYHIIYDE